MLWPEGLSGIQNLKNKITGQNWVWNGSNIIPFLNSQWKIRAFRPLNHSNLTIFDQDMKKNVDRHNFRAKKPLFQLPVSGDIQISILMPPETGNWKKPLLKLPILGGIKMSFSMPPETGNIFSYLGQKWSDFSDLKV